MMNRMMTWDAGVSRRRMILVLLGALIGASGAAGQEQWLTYHAGSTMSSPRRRGKDRKSVV